MAIIRFYRYPGLTDEEKDKVCKKIACTFAEHAAGNLLNSSVDVKSELCFYVEVKGEGKKSSIFQKCALYIIFLNRQFCL